MENHPRKAYSLPDQSSEFDDEDDIKEEELKEQENNPHFKRTHSLDPKFLQRSPSFYSIRSSFSPPCIATKDQMKDSLTDEEDSTDIVNKSHETEENDFEVVGAHVNCIECVKPIPVFSPDDLEPGDHIIFSGAVYDHHGIIVSKLENGEIFKIIEASNTVWGASAGISKIFGGKANIKPSWKKFDFKNEKICVVIYKHRYSKLETIKRAQNGCYGLEGSSNYKYNLFYNNCEHFATYCVTGKKFSVQVTKLKLTCRLFWSRGFVGISNELERNIKEFENGIICKDCYEMNRKLLGVNLRSIENEGDVEKGDIIRYYYWNLWHEAVVLEKTKTTKSNVECTIAHYAFCGPLSHRTIREERLVIELKGQCSKLDYISPQYDVYEPDEVVKRARMRIGEQLFAFFSNDSSHFARWCKLKLHRF